jgi:acyl-coenzyme A synthetase/AMP-(fatty) acid ligase
MTSLVKQLKEIIAGPIYPQNDYILSRYTYEDVYTIAGHFQQKYFSSGIKEESICLCVNDRAVIAGALLAALTRPVTLIIPYSFSASVLASMHQAHAFSKAIVQEPTALPRDVKAVFFDRNNIGKNRLDPSFVREPDNVFVKLFTGGSTQTPRIWSKTVRNLFSEAIYQATKLGASPNDRFVATVPANHIYGLLFSVLTPLIASSSVFDGEPSYPHEIQNAICQNQASILVSIPIHYKMLAGIEFTAESLRSALSSAARLDPADNRAFYQKARIGITEIFGSTETGGIASRICEDNQLNFNVFDCIDWKLVNNHLAIRSDFISPELPADSEGFFITSDQAKIAGPYEFELIGRADRIVKVGGKRVDLDEIKLAITAMPEVKDAAVICIPKGNSRENEILALVAADTTSSEIRQYLQKHIQSCAVPRRIKVVDKIPISSAGKYKNSEIKRLLESFPR